MKEEQSYEHLLQALLDIKGEIAKQIRPVEEQIFQANIDHLKQTFERDKNKLDECLDGIDRKIAGCCQHIEEYERIRSHLHTLNEKLSHLGAEPLPLPDSLPTIDPEEITKGRLEHLRSQGKPQTDFPLENRGSFVPKVSKNRDLRTEKIPSQ